MRLIYGLKQEISWRGWGSTSERVKYRREKLLNNVCDVFETINQIIKLMEQ